MATIKGKWQWNDVVNCTVSEQTGVVFTSGGQQFAYVSCIWAVGYHHFQYIDVDGVSIEAGKSANEGDNFFSVKEEYRVVDFGNKEQDITDWLYDFIVSNATVYQPTRAEKLILIAENQQKVFDAGKQSERNAFWDAFQTPSRRLWYGAFQNACWNDTTFYPKYDITPTEDASNLFRYCDITDLEGRLNECGVTLDTSEATRLNCAFGESKVTALPTIDLSKCASSASDSHGVFAGCKDLTSIRKVIVSEAVVLKNTFTTCNSLQNIDFEGVIGSNTDFKASALLSIDSMKSIISCLKNYSGTDKEYTYTLTFTEERWATLEADSTAPDGGTWREYVTNLGWNT